MIDQEKKIVVSKTPLRLSLVGGSTDLDSFLQKYNNGSVISFTPNIYTFISLHSNNTNYYIINYSQKEKTLHIDEIKNDIARLCLKYFDVKFCTVTFNTNILSTGSGLASSSSYTISLIKAISIYQQINLTDYEICKLAFDIEKQFNPLAGQQDIYGCGIGGFKRIDFNLSKPPSFRYLDISFILNNYDMYLLNTNLIRNSTNILQKIDIDKSYKLLKIVDNFEESILDKDTKNFFDIFNLGWQTKKETSSEILADSNLLHIDNVLSSLSMIKGYKLCGSGGGGYFLMFVDKNNIYEFEILIKEKLPNNMFTKIGLDHDSIRAIEI